AFFDLHYTEEAVMHYFAAGEGRDVSGEETGETVPVSNNIYREAQQGGWKIIKIVGDSMADSLEDGDFMYIKPISDWSLLRDDDVVACLYRGQQIVKKLRFKRGSDG